jgi:hypothetical protein
MLAREPIKPEKKVRAIQRRALGANCRILLSIKPCIVYLFSAAVLYLRYGIVRSVILINKSIARNNIP